MGWNGYGYNGIVEFGHLGMALGEDKLPNLRVLEVEECELRPPDLGRALKGLEGQGGLQRLRLCNPVLQTDIGPSLVGLLQAKGGALVQLEELDLEYWAKEEWGQPWLRLGSWDPTLAALGGGAPCAATLKALRISGKAFTETGVLTLFEALGRGAFPSLVKLSVEYVDSENRIDLVRALAPALLALAERGTPSRLEFLEIIHKCLRCDTLNALTAVFAADALPRLVDLRVDNDELCPCSLDFEQIAETWPALGDKVKLERLILTAMYGEEAEEFSAIVEQPSFCPLLRAIRPMMLDVSSYGNLPSPFEARRRKRDKLAVREEQREATQARIATLEARVQELEAVVESQRQQLQRLGQEKK